MQRGDVITVVLPGTYGKPRPALIIQADIFNALASITVMPITSTITKKSIFRIKALPSKQNGLLTISEIMVDKITTIPKDKIGEVIGQMEDSSMLFVMRAMIVFLGIVE